MDRKADTRGGTKRYPLTVRMLHRVSSTSWFMRTAPKILPPVDRTLHKVSGGRLLVAQWTVPTILLRTTGRKSGVSRHSPLICMRDNGSFIVVGSNFGGECHPAWTANLLHIPEAQVTYRGRVIPVTACLLTGDERDAVWHRLLRLWPPYSRYAERANGREMRVFRLLPTKAQASAVVD